MKRNRARTKRQTGFTLIESMIAILVLAIGILAVTGVFAQGIIIASMTQWDYIAEKKAEAAMEAIFASRDSLVLQWAQIQNVSQGGIFLDGAQPMLTFGTDGLVGTAADAADPTVVPDTVIIGPGGQVMGLNLMTREIQIGPTVNLDVRTITIILRYRVGQYQRTYTLVSYISAYA